MNGSSGNATVQDGRGVDRYCDPVPNLMFEALLTSRLYIANSALNALSSIFATVGNILVFAAVRRVASIRLTSKLLLYNLLMTDICVGLVAQPQYAAIFALRARQAPGHNCLLLKSFFLVTPVLSCASLLIMTAISLDRYSAMAYRILYHKVVTTRRVRVALAVAWSFSAIYASSRFWNETLFKLVTVTASFVCFLVISVSYIKIYRALCRQELIRRSREFLERQVVGQRLNATTPRYRRLATTMMCVYVLFIACYSPYFCARLISVFFPSNSLVFIAREFLYTLVLCNSTLNPLVYCFFLRDVRAEVRRKLRNVLCLAC